VVAQFPPDLSGWEFKMTQEEKTADLSDTIRFVLEIDKLKSVLRKVRPVGEDRYENTAEHSWQIALFGLSLAQTLRRSA
jgi:putative hydrolase of HD superfamily